MLITGFQYHLSSLLMVYNTKPCNIVATCRVLEITRNADTPPTR